MPSIKIKNHVINKLVLNSLPNFIAETNKVDHTGPWASTSWLQTLTKFTTYNKQAILIVKNVCTFHEGTKLKAKIKRGTQTFDARARHEVGATREPPLRLCD